MQYILTEEVYKNLVPKSDYDKKCHDVQTLNKLVLKKANFKCIHDRTGEELLIYGYLGYGPALCRYCDDCPLVKAGTCTRAKKFSQ